MVDQPEPVITGSPMTAGRQVREAATVHVAALYKFAPLPDCTERKSALQAICERHGVTGTLLLASEGINGTIAGSRAGLENVVAEIRRFPGFQDMDVKWSTAAKLPFIRLKVRLKREIVTMGVPDIDPTKSAGTYVGPEDWNDLIRQPDVVLLDTRNEYEVALGTFKGAVDPKTTSFREFPEWASRNLDKGSLKKIAMFCTGGIRCEKATAFLKAAGFDNVYHLKGGILKYLETVPAEQSMWDGECFVFDQRVSVGHGLEPGPYQLCSICRGPFLSGEGSGGYAHSLCSVCTDAADDDRKRRAADRLKQIELAKARGGQHLGRKS